jgi:hypothetical protein
MELNGSIGSWMYIIIRILLPPDAWELPWGVGERQFTEAKSRRKLLSKQFSASADRLDHSPSQPVAKTAFTPPALPLAIIKLRRVRPRSRCRLDLLLSP